MTRVQLKYVNQFRDRHGKLRFYFRRPGFKNVPLLGLPGSVEFMETYQAALAGVVPRSKSSVSVKPGTVAALVSAYLNSQAFGNLSPEFQRTRRNILERFVVEHGDKRVALLGRDHVQHMVSAKAATPFAARNFLNSLRALMAYAIKEHLRGDDPTVGVERVRAKTRGFRTWTEEDIAAYRLTHKVGTRARLALELLLNTGQRRSDVVRMGRQHIRDGFIEVRQQKTGTELSIPIHPDLTVIIDATPSEHLTFLVTKDGKPFSAAGFTNWFRECCNEACLQTGTSAHGLRKAMCRRLAEAGCSAPEIMAISGHRSLSEVQHYIEEANQKILARASIDALVTGNRTQSYKPQ